MRLVAALGASCLAACGPAAQGPAESAKPTVVTEVTRYLPLEHDTVFTYATYIEETNERGIAIFEIKRPRPELAELSVAGQVRKRYYFEAAGVKSSMGGYLLKSPLQLGSEWTGDDGKVKVTSIEQSVNVPAGKFSGCLQTLEDAQLGSARRRTTTVFCPGVGITVLQIEANQEGTSINQRLELKAFGPRFKGL